MKREWGERKRGWKIMQFNPGETEEIEKKREREENRVMKLVGKKKERKRKSRGEMRIEWKAAGGGKWGMKRRSNGRV